MKKIDTRPDSSRCQPTIFFCLPFSRRLKDQQGTSKSHGKSSYHHGNEAGDHSRASSAVSKGTHTRPSSTLSAPLSPQRPSGPFSSPLPPSSPPPPTLRGGDGGGGGDGDRERRSSLDTEYLGED